MGKEPSTGSSPDQIFEQARSYLEKGNLDESLTMLSALLDLQPDNAEYLAWQARGFFAKNDPGALEVAELAISLDENQSMAYSVRGAILGEQQKYREAIENLTKAIELDPRNDWALRRRADSYEKIGDLKNTVIDRARSYAVYLPQFNSEDGPFYTAEKHFRESLDTVLKDSDEHLVGYWDGGIYWGLDEQKKYVSGTSYTDLYGFGGVGYIYLTNRHIRIASIAQLTQRFPPLPKKMGLLAQTLLLVREIDYREVEQKDRIWTIPNSSIIEAKLTKPTGFSDRDVKFVKLATDVETWEIACGNQNILLAALNMAATGELANIWGGEKQEGHSEDEILALIEKISELRQKGAISGEDFEAKKKELLSRL